MYVNDASRLGLRLEAVSVDQLAFEAGEEALGYSWPLNAHPADFSHTSLPRCCLRSIFSVQYALLLADRGTAALFPSKRPRSERCKRRHRNGRLSKPILKTRWQLEPQLLGLSVTGEWVLYSCVQWP